MNRKQITRALFVLIGAVALSGVVSAQEKAIDKPIDTTIDRTRDKALDKTNDNTMERSAPVVGRIPLGVTVEEKEIVATGYRASKLVKSDVFNDKGEKIGKVEDVLVAPNGELTVAVVDVGGFLGMDKHRVAVPVRQFSRVVPKGAVLPGATKNTLKEMPPFEYVK